MPINRSSLTIGLLVLLAGFSTLVACWTALYLYLSPNLPAVESLREIKFQTPLRIYSADNQLIGEFGEIRRIPVSFEEAPPLLIKAFLAAEDDRFYSHNGVDIRGILRAASRLLQTGERQGGGSTITMQVAKNSFPINDGSFIYKAKQIFLAFQIEKELEKNDILEIYINQNFLGNRAKGVGAAARVYYGKDVSELSLAQWAMIAGLPKAPSTMNPLVNPERALERRDWILSRMASLDFITEDQYQQAIAQPVSARYHDQQVAVNAPYLAEMVRQHMVDTYGQSAYEDGYRVYTTVNSELQKAGQEAVIDGLLAYTQRHGYHGPELNIPPVYVTPADTDSQTPDTDESPLYAVSAPTDGEETSPDNADTPTPQPKQWVDLTPWLERLDDIPSYGGLQPAVVVEAQGQRIKVLLRDGDVSDLPWDNGPSDARPYLSETAGAPGPTMPKASSSPGMSYA